MPTPAPLDAAALRERVQVEVGAALAAHRRHLTGIAPELGEMTDALAALLAGGKRVRPAFAYWGWRAAGGGPAGEGGGGRARGAGGGLGAPARPSLSI